jgi:hypothetical protein
VNPTEAQADLIARHMTALRKIVWEATGTELLAIMGIGPEDKLTVIAPTHLQISPAALDRAGDFCDAVVIANNVLDRPE